LKEKGNNWMLMAGVFAGLALSIKPTAIVAIGAAALAILWRDGWLAPKKNTWAIFAVFPLMEVGPWLIKNNCFAGNAFFPYAVSWMGGRQFSVWGYERLLHENQQFLPMDHGLLSVLTLPWRLTIPGAGDDQFIGPLLLAFLPILLLLHFKEPSLKFLGRTLVLSFLFGLTLSHMLRFSIPAFILAFLIFSAVLSSLKGEKWGTLWISAVAASAILCAGEYLHLSATWYDGRGIWNGEESRDQYLIRKIGPSGGAMAQWVNTNLPKGARLLIVGDAQVLYYQRPVYANSVFDEQFFAAAAHREKDTDGILRRLKELGVNYVVFDEQMGMIHSSEYHQYELSSSEWRKLRDFAQEGLEFVSGNNNHVSLYRVRDALVKTGQKTLNPFYLYPMQTRNLFEDLSNGEYARAK